MTRHRSQGVRAIVFHAVTAAFVVACLTAATSLRAQTTVAAPDRPGRQTLVPQSLRDSLARVTDPIQRRVLLERLVERFPLDPLPHTELSASLISHPLIRLAWGGGHESSTDRALDELKRALQADPLYVPAAIALGDYALRTHDQGDLAAARTALDRIARAKPADAAVAIEQARVAAEQGDAPAAVAAADRARAAGAGDGAVERAAGMALMLGASAASRGGRVYLDALAAASPAVRLEYLTDARWLLDDSTFAAWKERPQLLPDSLTTFWSKQAAAAGVPVEERLAEHFRRVRVARREYPTEPIARKWVPPSGAVVSERDFGRDFDDRGLIYIKHGKPTTAFTRTVSLPTTDQIHSLAGVRDPRQAAEIAAAQPTTVETWVYDYPDGQRQLFFFRPFADVSGMRMVSSPVIQPSLLVEPSVLRLLAVNAEAQSLLMDLGSYDARYGLLAAKLKSAGASSDPGVREGLRILIEDNLTTGRILLQRNTYVPAFAADLPFAEALYQFREGAQTRLVAALGIPAGGLDAVEVPGGWAYSFRVRFAVTDTVAGGSWQVDTTLALRAPTRLRPEDVLRVALPLDVPPRPATVYRLSARAGTGGDERGRVVGGDLAMRGFLAGSLTMSDVVVASGRPGSWHRGDVALALNPAETFQASRPFTVFYELYGLPRGAGYRTTIEVFGEAPIGEWVRGRKLASKASFSVRFEQQSAPGLDGVVRDVRDVQPQLKPGSYRIRVTVEEDGTARRTSAERRIRIVE